MTSAIAIKRSGIPAAKIHEWVKCECSSSECLKQDPDGIDLALNTRFLNRKREKDKNL